MRNERKYRILTLFSVLLFVLLIGNCIREPYRLSAMETRQHDEYVLKGAKVYAQNCIQCHGPHGEGVIGMPLNRQENRADLSKPAGKAVYEKISTTVRQGRQANSTHFQWEKAPDGNMISYTTMPAWGKDFGGPMDDDYVKAVTLFIMNPDASQWNIIGTELAPPQDPDLKPDVKTGQITLPDSQVDASTNAAAKALLNNLGKSMCLTCHAIGSKGAKVGPDLTHVGSWGIDQSFLETWIKYANQPQANDADKTPAVPHCSRMPCYWSANRATAQPNLNLATKVISEGPYYMPRFKGRLSDDEIALLAKYLMGLK